MSCFVFKKKRSVIYYSSWALQMFKHQERSERAGQTSGKQFADQNVFTSHLANLRFVSTKVDQCVIVGTSESGFGEFKCCFCHV